MTTPFYSVFFSIRGKLTLATMMPLVLILVLVALAASYLINASIVDQTQKQIRQDLNAAQVVLEEKQRRLYEVVRFTARSLSLSGSFRTSDRESLQQLLSEIRQHEQLDILRFTGPKAKALVPTHGKKVTSIAEIVTRTLTDGPLQEIVLLSEAELEHDDPDLAERARIYDHTGQSGVIERRAMFLIASVPLFDSSGKVMGCLYGGVLLNNNLALVDRIQEVVYGSDEYEGIAVGSATIFLETRRIATTIRLQNGSRALGTLVSEQVAEAVLQHSDTWLDRALVVNEWYLTAYEPIFNNTGQTIGALYVGMLEKPLIALKKRAFMTLFGLLIVGCVFGGLLAGWLARRLSQPLLALTNSAKKIAGGERDVSLPVAGQDEIGHLTHAFADMTNALRLSDQELQNLNHELEKKVAERTSQLKEKSLQLIETREQLLLQEKLVAIGSLATGVAHEINNPAAIIRGNVEIMQMSLPEDAGEREELAEIMKQVERISLITQNLLSSSRQQSLNLEPVQIPALIDEILEQLNHQTVMTEIKVWKAFGKELPAVEGDRERLRQVFTNIMLNAAQAMAGEGELSLAGSVVEDRVRVQVADTGPGIDENLQGQIFNPFFTTKSNGTGLGLSVSSGIIRAHNGLITVSSGKGQGTVFWIDLPIKQRFIE
ncbi:HAMP domain-containing histidine kinase [Desulfogranum japonicum]|uniref:HAMP domain-containing histidine kinase n=1 Tax=Desulfogranum japonicum TaxID=231447 RepID=UPI0004052336|nr:HAMP domain-containing histidine kinase [Desulfogranum japonicum]